MDAVVLASITDPVDNLALARRAAPVVLLALFWGWESWRPFFGRREGRYRHAVHNLAIALVNTAVIGLIFGTVTLFVTEWTQRSHLGLLNALAFDGPFRFILALILLDGWMYLWHRANHAIPLLWRFHRMHHSDPHMDVTTATRFHLGEHVGSGVLRLALIPLVGFEIWNLVVYELLVMAVIMFHHADISLGRWDRWLRLAIVTPDMHKVHHSDWLPETDSNYSTVLSVWDRLAGSFRMRERPREVVFGLEGYEDTHWQTFAGMWATPFVDPRTDSSLVRSDRADSVREESLV